MHKFKCVLRLESFADRHNVAGHNLTDGLFVLVEHRTQVTVAYDTDEFAVLRLVFRLLNDGQTRDALAFHECHRVVHRLFGRDGHDLAGHEPVGVFDLVYFGDL